MLYLVLCLCVLFGAAVALIVQGLRRRNMIFNVALVIMAISLLMMGFIAAKYYHLVRN